MQSSIEGLAVCHCLRAFAFASEQTKSRSCASQCQSLTSDAEGVYLSRLDAT